MSNRNSVAGPRSLTLTEELEKLEQSITLTLQEIDHNFSRAHRIVTTSILPIVEQYAKHSEAVWDGSKFWKQFFEASANVSLSGYEELAEEGQEDDTDLTHSHAEETYMTNQTGDETARLEHTPQHDAYHDDFLDENPDISGSTPRAPPTRSDLAQQQRFADYGDSPYADLTQKMKGAAITSDPEDDDDIDLTLPPVTPGTEQRLPRMAMGTPLSSPFKPSAASTKKPDTLLHRVMDKNYRLQATPLAGASSRKPMAAHHGNKTPSSKPSWRDMDSPGSSSPIEAPKLRTEIFSSPVRDTRRRPAPVAPTPRTPGISVQTPAKKTPSRGYLKDEITWESSGDEGDDVYQRLGMSPPKPIHFDIPPGRLLQTPAQEAGRRIVEDLLETAGAGKSLDWGEDSPSMVRPSGGMDDSF